MMPCENALEWKLLDILNSSLIKTLKTDHDAMVVYENKSIIRCVGGNFLVFFITVQGRQPLKILG